VVFFVLADRPAQARWLAPDERDALEGSPASGTRSGPASPACVCSTRFAIREC
jgi:hypothetical protein